MCGIGGIYSPSGCSEDTLARMNECLVHRGPDDSGVHVDGPVGLAHRRLSIIDPESGQQPLFNEEESVVVVFNGEIYNHESLRDTLDAAGHRFTSGTDTEVIVHGYEEWGDEVLSRLDGMFAFALWDGDAGRLLLARDPMGIKPLYLGSDDDGRVAFASELPALFESGLDLGGLDRDAIAEYFAFGYVPAPKSVFGNVSKLRPGELCVLSEAGVERTDFYSPDVERVDVGFDAAATELRSRVERAVECRLQSDVPLGAFLSGGIDSSIVTGVLSSITDSPPKTFSVGFSEDRFDETWAAREVAAYHDTDHHEFVVSPSDVREVIDEVVPRLGEPFADSSILPTYVVSRETSRDLTVALSGDGADELFAGYNKYRGEYLSRYYRAVPGSIRSTVSSVVNRLPASRGTRRGDAIRKGQTFVEGADANRAERQYRWMAITGEEGRSAFGDLDHEGEGLERVEEWQRAAVETLPDGRRDSLSVMQMVDARYALPSGILTKVDLASMLNSLEVRVPFLDTAVFEYAMGLPRGFKITPTTRKRILRAAFEDLLPPAILDRGKQGFEVPIGEWFKDELADEFRTTVETVPRDLVDVGEVAAIYDEHVHGRRDHANFLWAVYVFARWHERMRRQGILE